VSQLGRVDNLAAQIHDDEYIFELNSRYSMKNPGK